jgi:hypothetical protein
LPAVLAAGPLVPAIRQAPMPSTPIPNAPPAISRTSGPRWAAGTMPSLSISGRTKRAPRRSRDRQCPRFHQATSVATGPCYRDRRRPCVAPGTGLSRPTSIRPATRRTRCAPAALGGSHVRSDSADTRCTGNWGNFMRIVSTDPLIRACGAVPSCTSGDTCS